MSKALSIDLRVRVLAAVSAGATHREAAERFGVSAASVSRWRNLQLRQGDVRPGPLGGDRNSRKNRGPSRGDHGMARRAPRWNLVRSARRAFCPGHHDQQIGFAPVSCPARPDS